MFWCPASLPSEHLEWLHDAGNFGDRALCWCSIDATLLGSRQYPTYCPVHITVSSRGTGFAGNFSAPLCCSVLMQGIKILTNWDIHSSRFYLDDFFFYLMSNFT
ncbi:hypothetical protein QL093DRAFT_2222455, partial [Fusarium oxysporum]